MTKLWEKDYQLNEELEAFTVGNDYLLDQRLVRVDVLCGMAHAKMLASIGVVTGEELQLLLESFRVILDLDAKGEFAMCLEDEDVHTKVENFLTTRLGVAGKKIHTGRSRNDQVLADIRLYTKESLHEVMRHLLQFAHTLWEFSRRHEWVPVAGRTHTQRAMPSTVGTWSASFCESMLDNLSLLQAAYRLNDQSPLGSAASYGVALPIDREMTARLLGFERVQNNVLYANTSRGKMESVVLFALAQVMLDLSKLAQDLILFSLPELGYVHLPREFCCGSSIMPQKMNPAGMELVRARASTSLAQLYQVLEVIKALPSGYNLDFQETKEPLLRGLDLADGSVKICDLVMAAVEVDEEACRRSCTSEIFAADRALELVKEGMPWRDAYHHVARHLDELESVDPIANLRSKRHQGAPGNLGLEGLEKRIEKEAEWADHIVAKHRRTIDHLLHL